MFGVALIVLVAVIAFSNDIGVRGDNRRSPRRRKKTQQIRFSTDAGPAATMVA